MYILKYTNLLLEIFSALNKPLPQKKKKKFIKTAAFYIQWSLTIRAPFTNRSVCT